MNEMVWLVGWLSRLAERLRGRLPGLAGRLAVWSLALGRIVEERLDAEHEAMVGTFDPWWRDS